MPIKKETTATEAEGLADEAWVLITQMLHQGKFIIQSGQQFELGPKGMYDLITWLADKKTKKPKLITLDVDLPETQ